MTQTGQDQLFQDREWLHSYKTSSIKPDGQSVNILHDFYIPVLKLSISYDRVAGYFRSTSLAAASQGFSAFSAGGGRMRMIVGADLDQADVSAILSGDEKRAAEQLGRELTGMEAWPEDVRHGVELLAWMVACGVLEVRVGFRVHGQTSEPVPFDSCLDGYVHEKWAVFTDSSGSRIYISGSLNESRKALVHNAENISLHTDWWGDRDRQRVDDAALSFEQLWENRNPFIRVLTLPEAVQQKLVQIGENITELSEIDGSEIIKHVIKPPSALERLAFALIKDGPRLPGGRYVGMETAPVKPWPHQEIVSRRLIRTWPYSYLLCDEVGLGKTIEAGLAIRSLYLSGLVRRVLVAPPASLALQWQREMADKFFLPFARLRGGSSFRHEYIFPGENTAFSTGMYEPDLSIVSTGLMTRDERLEELKRADPFDVVLVDEAHHARRKNPKDGERTVPRYGRLYNIIRDRLVPAGRCLWMATATPMQLDWIEVFDLISLTRRIAHFQKDPSLTWAYYRVLNKLIHDQEPKGQEWEFMRRALNSVQRYDPLLWEYLNSSVIDGRMKSTARLWLEHSRIPRGMDRNIILKLIFAAAPLSRVMLRHTRPLLEIYRENGRLEANLARREILPVPSLVLSGLEKEIYQALEDYCRALTRKLASNSRDRKWRTSLGFYLSFLRLRLASSTFAIRETIKRRLEKVRATLMHMDVQEDFDVDTESHDRIFGYSEDIDENVISTLLKNRTEEDLTWEAARLNRLLELMKDLSGMPLKMKELLSVLQSRRCREQGRIRQTVVFTRFYDTLSDIVRLLLSIDPSMRVGSYSGQGGQYLNVQTKRLTGAGRDDIRHRFLRGEIDVLVCTDAAAEGLNLQTADLVINYDLPWNPMKVEQRIGRIDRIGQNHAAIYVLNLCYVDSAEQIVYDRLLTRLSQTFGVVGTQQISMLPVTEEEFAELASGDLKEDTLFKRATRRIKEQQERSSNFDIPARDLYEIYLRIKDRQDEDPVPVSLENIWEALKKSKYLQDHGMQLSPRYPVLDMPETGPISKAACLTIDRELYEKGVPDLEGRLHFASYGDPVFDDVLEEFEGLGLPECVVRLEKQVPDTKAVIVAYVVQCINRQGESETRLITRYSDLENIVLDEETRPDEQALQDSARRLHQIMRKEFDPTRSIERIIQDNEQAGYAHDMLNLLVADCLMPDVMFNLKDNFWHMVRHMEGVIAEREALLVPKMPTDLLAAVQDSLLSEIPVPKTGDRVTASLPFVLVESALNRACRLADSMRQNRADMTIEKVKNRIQAEISKHWIK